MPSPKECRAKLPDKNSKAYKDCIAYKNQGPVKGRARKTKGPAQKSGY